MEETRSQIRNTVAELREKVSETLDWRHYVDRYPGTSLTLAVGVGMLVGRGLASVLRRGREEPEPYGYGAYRTAESYGESGFTAAASAAASQAGEVAQAAYRAAEPSLSGARRAVGQSVSRLGSRTEGILNRLIDELTDAVETTLVPAITARFRGLIDLDSRSGRRREGGRGGGFGGEVAEPGRARWEEREDGGTQAGGAYAGGPAGSQHYPGPGRTAEQA